MMARPTLVLVLIGCLLVCSAHAKNTTKVKIVDFAPEAEVSVINDIEPTGLLKAVWCFAQLDAHSS